MRILPVPQLLPALPCGCDPNQPPAANTRCRVGWGLYQDKLAAPNDLARHETLVAIAWHQTSEGQARALLGMRRAA